MITHIVEIICLVFAILFLRNEKRTFAKITIGYLIIVVVTELVASFYMRTYHKSNSWMYNLFIWFEAGYISYGFYAVLSPFTKRAKLYSLSAFGIFLVAYFVEMTQVGFFRLHSVTIAIFSVLFVVLSLQFFALLIKKEESFDITKYADFWWVAAVLFFYFGGTVYNIVLSYWINNKVGGLKILVYVMQFLNVVLYFVWSYSFLCSYRQKKLSS